MPLDISYRLTVDNRMMRAATQNYESYVEVEVIKAYRGYTDIRDYIQWYKEAIDQKGLAGWNLIKDERDGNEYLSLIHSFPADSLGRKGVLVINVDKQQLSSILDQESFTTLIVDNSGGHLQYRS